MKNKLLIILIIIVLLVVYYLLGTGYLKQRRQQAVLTPQIGDVTRLLAQMPEPPQDLEQRLASARADLTAGQSAFINEINSTRAIDTILKLADRCHVKAIPLLTEPWSAVKIGEHEYNVFGLNVSVEGNFSNLVDFIDKLENDEFETLVVENLSVTGPEVQSEEETASEDDMFTASLSLAIYTGHLAAD